MQAPPLVIACSRVVAYAHIPANIPFKDRARVFVDGIPLGRVPKLAICMPFRPSETLLIYCDNAWEPLAASGGKSVDLLKQRAETDYPGLAAAWIDTKTSIEEALRYYDETFEAARCRSCGKRSFEVDTMTGSDESGWSCNNCNSGQ